MEVMAKSLQNVLKLVTGRQQDEQDCPGLPPHMLVIVGAGGRMTDKGCCKCVRVHTKGLAGSQLWYTMV